jgi:hypothetical protein
MQAPTIPKYPNVLEGRLPGLLVGGVSLPPQRRQLKNSAQQDMLCSCEPAFAVDTHCTASHA